MFFLVFSIPDICYSLPIIHSNRRYVGLQLRANALGMYLAKNGRGLAPTCRLDIQIEAIGVRYLPKISGQV